MTVYTKTTWATGATITAALLNNLETQYDDVATGIAFVGATSVTISSATAFTVANSGSNYGLQVDTSTASSATGVKIKSAAAAGGVAVSAISSGTNEDIIISGKGSGKVKLNSTYGDITADVDGATITFDMAVSDVHGVTLGGNRTLAVSNVSAGQSFAIRLLQDGTGSRTVTWFSTIKWAGGSAPTLTTTASKADIIGFLCTTAGNYDGFVCAQNI